MQLPVSVKIALALTIAVVFIFAALWQMANVRGLKARGRRRRSRGVDLSSQRSSDKNRQFTRLERKLYNESQKMLEDGKVPAAAAILEQLSLQREAIQALEDHGFIHDAAKMLMRMQRHNRAGVVYARHGMWEHAAQCFKMANMPAEVAKCAREFGDVSMACEYFEKAQRYEDAAECADEMGDSLRAARLFLQGGQQSKAMTCFGKSVTKAGSPRSVDLRTSEFQAIANYLVEGRSDNNLALLLHANDRLIPVVLKQLSSGMGLQVAEILMAVKSDIVPLIMAEINYRDKSGTVLAEILMKTHRYQYAAMVYEQLLSFELAAVAFDKAGDAQRAAYCRERAGVPSRAVHPGRSSVEPALQAISQSPAADLPAAPRATPVPPPAPAQSPAPSAAFRAEFALATLTEVGRESGRAPVARSESPSNQIPPGANITGFGSTKATSQLPQISREDSGLSAFVKAPLCGDLTYEQSNALWNIGSSAQYKAGETILGYNDDPRGIYVVLRGQVSCYRRYGEKDAFIDQMTAADSFGELWLLADTPSAVHFVAVRDVDLRIIDRAAFLRLLEKDSTIAGKLYKRFAMRLLDKLLNQQQDRKNPLAS